MGHGAGRCGPGRPASPRSHPPHPALRSPRTGRQTCCGGRCGRGQHDALHPQHLVRTPQNFYGHVYLHGGATTAVGAPGPVCDLGSPWTCWLRAAAAVSIHAITAPSQRPDHVHGTKDTADAPGLADGRARGLEAHLRIINALLRAYHPRCPPTPALSICTAHGPTPIKGLVTCLRHRDAFSYIY